MREHCFTRVESLCIMPHPLPHFLALFLRSSLSGRFVVTVTAISCRHPWSVVNRNSHIPYSVLYNWIRDAQLYRTRSEHLVCHVFLTCVEQLGSSIMSCSLSVLCFSQSEGFMSGLWQFWGLWIDLDLGPGFISIMAARICVKGNQQAINRQYIYTASIIGGT